MIDAAQIKAARALLNMSQADLASLASLHVATIRRLEASFDPRGNAVSILSIVKALEDAGVEFIPADETKGPGVRLKHQTAGKPSRRAKARAK
jgi:transcriptional regulator with XRE-family HTH domain